MQVSVEKPSTLERRMSVAVEEDRIATEVKTRLQDVGRNARIDGFRPGRAPIKIIEAQFGARVREEVVSEVLRKSFAEALDQEKLHPASEPKIDSVSDNRGEGLSFTAVFEIFPDFEFTNVETLKIQRPSCAIEAGDLDEMIETLRSNSPVWKEVDRLSKEGDHINIAFTGTIDGEEFEGGSAEDFDLEIGKKVMIEGFESGLAGKGADDSVILDLVFPESYGKAELAGKPVRFDVKIKYVSESSLPELNDEFFEKYGVKEGGVEAFRQEVRENMEREREAALTRRFKINVMEALSAAHEFETPKSMIEAEVARMQQQARQSMMMRGANPDDMPALDAQNFEEPAQKRVKLGLIMAEMIKVASISADPTKVRAKIEEMAASYEDASAVLKWHYDDPSRLSEIEAACIEEAAVEWVGEQAQIEEVSISFDDLINPGQTEIED